MDASRREFGLLTGAAALLGATPALAKNGAAAGKPAAGAWYQQVKRIMQINFTERDADSVDPEAWADYLVSVKAQCTFISVSSGVAFYPTALSDYPRSRWLDGRDVLGECVRAAKRRGIRTLGRLSPDIARKDLAERQPSWFRRTKNGELVRPGQSGRLIPSPDYAATCHFTGYFSDFVPKMIDEVMQRTGMDGMFTNGWPGSTVRPCYCATCQKIGDPESEQYRVAYQERAYELWDIFSKTVARRHPEAMFTGNLGEFVTGGELDLTPIMSKAFWAFADNQGRAEAFTPAWESSQQTRVAKAFLGSRPAVISTAAWSYTGSSLWRTIAGNPDEVRTRLFQTLAGGGTIHLHWLGFRQGFSEDRRWQEVGREVLTWQAANNEHFMNVASLADVGLVVSPRTNRLYKAPAGTDVMDSFQGAYRLLNEGRVPFDLVMDADLSLEKIGAYAVLILPNIAILDDRQAAQIRDYVARGGSVLTTFETGLYDDKAAARPEFALSDLFGMRKSAERRGFGSAAGHGVAGAGSMQRIEQAHPILEGFRNTKWIAGPSWTVPLGASGTPLLTDIPQHAMYPVEATFSPAEKTDSPTLVVREIGTSRLVHLAGDVESSYWRSSPADLGDLFLGAVRWLVRGRSRLQVEGNGLLEIQGRRTQVGYAIHMNNFSNPNFRGGALRGTVPVGAQEVTLRLPSAAPIRAARLLRANADLPFVQTGAEVKFVVPQVTDYEVAALLV